MTPDTVQDVTAMSDGALLDEYERSGDRFRLSWLMSEAKWAAVCGRANAGRWEILRRMTK